MTSAMEDSSRQHRKPINFKAMERADDVVKQRRLHQRATTVFDQMSSKNGGWLPLDQIHRYLEQTLRIDEGKLEEDAVTLVINTAKKAQQSAGVTPPSHTVAGALCKNAMVASVEKYDEFLSKTKEIDHVFEKFDKDEDGYLSREELRRMLQDYEKTANRSKHGLVINLQVLESDLDLVLEKSDDDGDGKISRAEYLPTLAVWEELVESKLQEKSEPCTIL